MSDTINYLNELRNRLILCIFTFVIGTGISFLYIDRIVEFLKVPAGNLNLIYVSPPEALMANVRLAAISGIVLAMPMIIYQSVAFIYPALYKNERRMIIPMISLSMILFITGVAFAYYIVYPFAISFFLKFATDDLYPYFTITAFLSFISNMIFSFGLVFQLPCIFWFLGKLRILKPQFLQTNRKYAFLIILIVAAIITPPDVFSQLLISIPLFVLYEIGIFFVKMSQWGNKEKAH